MTWENGLPVRADRDTDPDRQAARHAAALVVAAHARDPQDCYDLLGALGLTSVSMAHGDVGAS